MEVNDERDKLRQAEEWLMTCRPDSQEFEAALEHVRWTFRNSDLRDASKAVIQRVTRARHDEMRFRQKMKGFTL